MIFMIESCFFQWIPVERRASAVPFLKCPGCRL
jgi:hypothetical protein